MTSSSFRTLRRMSSRPFWVVESTLGNRRRRRRRVPLMHVRIAPCAGNVEIMPIPPCVGQRYSPGPRDQRRSTVQPSSLAFADRFAPNGRRDYQRRCTSNTQQVHQVIANERPAEDMAGQVYQTRVQQNGAGRRRPAPV